MGCRCIYGRTTKIFFQHINANYAMAGIDVTHYPVERIIYYIEDGEDATEPE